MKHSKCWNNLEEMIIHLLFNIYLGNEYSHRPTTLTYLKMNWDSEKLYIGDNSVLPTFILCPSWGKIIYLLSLKYSLSMNE